MLKTGVSSFLLLPFLVAALVFQKGGAQNEQTVLNVCYNVSLQDFIVNGTCDKPAATAIFGNEIQQTGWARLEVVTTADFEDEVQAYAAGVAEGVVTKDLIYQHWQNTIDGYCNGSAAYCKRLSAFLQENLDWMKKQIRAHPADVYWKQVNLTLIQLAGLEDGYFGMVVGPHTEISPFRFLLFQVNSDFGDLEAALNRTPGLSRIALRPGHCSAFVKPINNFQDLVFSHVTWGTYQSMLRIQKLYNFGYRFGEDGGALPGAKVSMSSYPGTLFSIDDFYITSAGLAIMETTIENYNKSLYKHTKPKGTLLTWMRVNLANRLSTKASDWVGYLKKFNSGTYNNQWMVVDYKKFQPGQKLTAGVFYVLELMPGNAHSEDMSQFINKQGYWPSYNIPYFKDIFSVSDTNSQVAEYGDWFTYDKAPRAQMFRRDWKNVVDMASLQKLMRYNNYRVDPLARCNCTPPYSAENAISARCDLNPANGTYPFSVLGHRSHGGTDMKATNYELFKSLQFVAISGPTYDDLEPFAWSRSDFAATTPHLGQPDEFKFAPVTYQWQSA